MQQMFCLKLKLFHCMAVIVSAMATVAYAGDLCSILLHQVGDRLETLPPIENIQTKVPPFWVTRYRPNIWSLDNNSPQERQHWDRIPHLQTNGKTRGLQSL